jgi:alkylation response protein AidB-like acyl-CoA dehydrogenase
MVDFRLDEDQRQIQDMFRKFGQEELYKVARECDEKAELPEDVLNKVWELGIAANCIPEGFGGYDMGRSAVTGAIMSEELAAGDASLAMGAMSPLLMSVPILEFGTEDQKKEWLPKFCAEKFYYATAVYGPAGGQGRADAGVCHHRQGLGAGFGRGRDRGQGGLGHDRGGAPDVPGASAAAHVPRDL